MKKMLEMSQKRSLHQGRFVELMVGKLHATTVVFCKCSCKANCGQHATPIVLECMYGSPSRSSQMETEADGVSNTVRVTYRAVPSRHKKQQEKLLKTHINCSSCH